MKSSRSAKQLTFLYFSMVACVIIIIHASVYESTTASIEDLYAQNRLTKINDYAKIFLANNDISGLASIEIQTQGKADFSSIATAYFDFSDLPENFPEPSTIPYGKGIEIAHDSLSKAHFVMKEKLVINGNPKDILLVLDNSLYELSESQLFSAHAKQLLLTFSLIIVSLLVVLKISARLTQPISLFADTLSRKSPDDLKPIPLPQGATTKELIEMVGMFNRYQERIRVLMERERSFNCYASHELRSPLMVIKGATTLLGESNAPDFIEKQRQRLNKATNEMYEFIETLLSLTKSIEKDELVPWLLTEVYLEKVIRQHEHLLGQKPVRWQVRVQENPTIRMPETAFHILISNLIKNAFAYTEQGTVTIEANHRCICVIDTGKGLKSKSKTNEGYGLGLLLVKDLCHKYSWHVELETNEWSGCTVTIDLA